MYKFFILPLFLVGMGTTASAVSYQTVIDYTPSGAFGTSTDTADGNQLIIDWDTALTVGNVSVGDLTDLTFTLNGSSGFIYSDTAIAGSLAQMIGGVARDLFDIEFFFDLDVAPTGDVLGLEEFDSDMFVKQDPDATGITYNFHGQGFDVGVSELYSVLYEDGNVNLTGTTVATVPVPAAGLIALSGVGALFGLRRRRKA